MFLQPLAKPVGHIDVMPFYFLYKHIKTDVDLEALHMENIWCQYAFSTNLIHCSQTVRFPSLIKFVVGDQHNNMSLSSFSLTILSPRFAD